jgi:type I restriction enzyme S subunit
MVQLRDIGTWYGGGTPSKATAEFWSGGDIPWLSPKDMRAEVLGDTQDHITVEAVRRSTVRMVPEPCVAVVVRSGILERALPMAEVPFPTTLNQDMKAIVPRSDVDLRYLRMAMQALVAPALPRLRKAGTTVASIDTNALKAVAVPLPSMDEQHRIVAVLDDHLTRLDAGASYVAAAGSRTAAAESALVVSLLLGRGNFSAARREVVADAGSLPELPAGWHWRRLGELHDVVGGVTKDAAKQHQPDYVEVPYLRVANVQRGRLDLSIVKTIRVSVTKAEQLRLLPGDVLLNEGGDRDKLGRGWVWAGEIDQCIHQNHVFRARVRDGLLRPKLLSWWVNTVGGEWCERHSRQSVNLASISLSRMRQMPIPVPPQGEQQHLEQQIEALTSGTARLRSATNDVRARAVTLRAALLAAAVAGKL